MPSGKRSLLQPHYTLSLLASIQAWYQLDEYAHLVMPYKTPLTHLSGWVTFAVSGTMQATLLVMCFMWKYRQSKLGLDDFGHPKHDGDERSFEEEVSHSGEHVDGAAVPEIAATEESPLLQKGPGRTSN